MRLKEVCKLTGLTDSAVRYYEKEGLLEVSRSNNNYRDFSNNDLETLKFIIKARNLGFSLPEIRDILKLKKEGTPVCSYVTEHMEMKISKIDEDINRLKEEKKILLEHLKEGRKVCGCHGHFCHYIEGVNED